MNPSTAQARVWVDEFVRCGVTEAVLSPGSWSTALALALYEHPAIRLHVRIDERSAGFLALGLAKASGTPVPVVCTSGTAAANLHPAVLEASHAGIPLLVLTADRAPELRDTGFNQTVDQLKLYGSAVRSFVEVETAEARSGMVAYWRSLVGRAVGHALDPRSAGPVHLNVPARKPFLPDGNPDWPEPLDGRVGGAPWVRVDHSAPSPVALDSAQRGVLVLGDGATDPAGAVRFAERAGWPVIAEPTSNARRGLNALSSAAFLLKCPSFVEQHRPDMVVTVGKVTLSQGQLGQGVLGLVQAASEHVVVDPTNRWPDPLRTASRVIPALAEWPARPGSPPSLDWLASWLNADSAARIAINQVVDAGDVPNEPRLAREVAASLPDGALLFVGSSMPIRDLDATMAPRDGLRILINRGVSGIDGVVSTAMGAALAHQRAGGGPAYALIGDLTLLHDQNGLVLGPDEPRPDLTFVVPNNDGGALFSVLPQGEVGAAFERIFGTPHGVDLARIAATSKIPYQLMKSMSQVDETVRTSTGGGVRLVEARTDRSSNADLHRRMQEAVVAAVDTAMRGASSSDRQLVVE